MKNEFSVIFKTIQLLHKNKEALKKIDKENNTELLQIIIIKSMIRTIAELHKLW